MLRLIMVMITKLSDVGYRLPIEFYKQCNGRQTVSTGDKEALSSLIAAYSFTSNVGDLIKWQYTHFEIDEEQFFEKMSKLGINRAASTKHLAEAENTIIKSGKLPSITDVRNRFKKGIIDEAEAINYLKRLQYRVPEQKRYMEEWMTRNHEI